MDIPKVFGNPAGADSRLAFDEEGRTCRILGVARYQLRDISSESIGRAQRPLLEESETNIVKHILQQTSIFGWFFDFMLKAAIGPRPRNRELLIVCALPRSAVGLDPNEKPGDFDVVIIPKTPEGFHLGEIMAVEVKILRSRKQNRDKHPRPSGTTQARGLVRDGFPFVGMLHLILCEPSPEENWKPLIRSRILNNYCEAELLPGTFPTDTISIETTERHFGRMQRYVDGSAIGAKAMALLLDDTGVSIIGRDLYSQEILPVRNASANREMLKRLCNVATSISVK